MEGKALKEKMVVDTDLEYSSKELTQWVLGPAAGQQGWKCLTRAAEHAHSWQRILYQMHKHEQTLHFEWVPSHVSKEGNEEADRRQRQREAPPFMH